MSFYYNIHNHSMKPVVTALGRRLKKGCLNGKKQFIKTNQSIKNTIKK